LQQHSLSAARDNAALNYQLQVFRNLSDGSQSSQASLSRGETTWMDWHCVPTLFMTSALVASANAQAQEIALAC